MRESDFQADLIREIKTRFPGASVLKRDARDISHKRGVPDLLILWRKNCASLEVKAYSNAPHQPGQDWYIDHIREKGGYAAFIYPENKDEILDEIQSAFRS